jgi:hypothetical protein
MVTISLLSILACPITVAALDSNFGPLDYSLVMDFANGSASGMDISAWTVIPLSRRQQSSCSVPGDGIAITKIYNTRLG